MDPYNHIGCFKDMNDRDLPATHTTRDPKGMTVDKCYQYCLSKEIYRYFGLQVKFSMCPKQFNNNYFTFFF